VIPSCW